MIQKDISGTVIVEKKDGSERFCVDYRTLYDVSIKDAYPLPSIDDSLDQRSGAKWFSCVDLSSSYWQEEVEECNQAKNSVCINAGLVRIKSNAFGLCYCTVTFERLMETVHAGLNWQTCLFYMVDVIVIWQTLEDMIEINDQVLSRLTDAGLKLNPRKCQLYSRTLNTPHQDLTLNIYEIE